MLFAPIGFPTMKGSWNIMFLSDVKYPGILYSILFLDFGGFLQAENEFLQGGVEIINGRFVSDRNLKFYRLIE